jgi:hypothetical protein
MKNSLKTILLFCFAIFGISVLAYMVNNVPRFNEKHSSEDVLQANDLQEDVEIRAYIKMQEIKFKVYPEKRHPSTGNWSTHADFKVLEPTETIPTFERDLVHTDSSGIGTIQLEHSENVPEGHYSVLIKGISHLTKRYDDIHFSKIAEYYDFTLDYDDLLAGDTHDSRDNFVNSLDISTLIRNLNTNNYVNDLNQDSQVNSLDLSNQVYNISKFGDV